MPTVSVIIPTYNLADYICEAIDSVLNQTFKDFEIIVVDDGSKDNTREVLKKYVNKISYFFKDNGGIASARNFGIKRSKGDYIALLDADDIWMPDKLEQQINIYNIDPEIAAVFTDAETFDNNGIIRNSLRPLSAPTDTKSLKYKIFEAGLNDGSVIKGDFYPDLINSNLFAASTALIKKSCLEKIGSFDENLVIDDDYDLWIRISKSFPVSFYSMVLMRYRIREDSASGTRGMRPYLYRKRDAYMFENHLKNCKSNFYKNLIKSRVLISYKIAAWGYLNVYDLSEARRLSIRCLRYNIFQIKPFIYILVSFWPKSFIRFVKNLKKPCQKSA